MASPFLAEIRMFGCTFAPKGWAFCNGQLLPISQNTALFSLLGTTYGGDGKSNFGLPNLQDSTPIAQGAGPGLTNRFPGESGGAPTVTLDLNETPAHPHTMRAYAGDPADSRTPGNNMSIGAPGTGNFYNPLAQGVQPMAAAALGMAGNTGPHNNQMPFQAVTFVIALQGIFPQRG
jgi:microcystin-dependent protein